MTCVEELPKFGNRRAQLVQRVLDVDEVTLGPSRELTVQMCEVAAFGDILVENVRECLEGRPDVCAQSPRTRRQQADSKRQMASSVRGMVTPRDPRDALWLAGIVRNVLANLSDDRLQHFTRERLAHFSLSSTVPFVQDVKVPLGGTKKYLSVLWWGAPGEKQTHRSASF